MSRRKEMNFSRTAGAITAKSSRSTSPARAASPFVTCATLREILLNSKRGKERIQNPYDKDLRAAFGCVRHHFIGRRFVSCARKTATSHGAIASSEPGAHRR